MHRYIVAEKGPITTEVSLNTFASTLQKLASKTQENNQRQHIDDERDQPYEWSQASRQAALESCGEGGTVPISQAGGNTIEL